MNQECVLSKVLCPGLRAALCRTAASAVSAVRGAYHSGPDIPGRTIQVSDFGKVWNRPYPVKGQWHGASRKQSFARAGWKRLCAQAGHLGEAAFLESRHHGGTMLSCQFY
jgi:hypothetical protein